MTHAGATYGFMSELRGGESRFFAYSPYDTSACAAVAWPAIKRESGVGIANYATLGALYWALFSPNSQSMIKVSRYNRTFVSASLMIEYA